MNEASRRRLDRSRILLILTALALLPATCVFMIGCGNGTSEARRVMARGKTLYDVSCGACHRTTGSGAEGVAAPLADSPWVTGSVERLVRIALHGVRGPIEVNGRTFNLEMPGFQNVFVDEDMSAILTYARQAWGNNASPVSPERVSAIRAFNADRGDSWTAEELAEW